MTSTFQWLNELMRWFGRWVPRLVLIRATHRGVLFGPGGSVRELAPGLWWYWPITSELEQVCITERSSQIATQLVGRRLLGMAVVWQATDVVLALTRYREIGARVDDAAQAALVHAQGDVDQVAAALADEFRGALRIVRVRLVHDGTGVPVKLFTDWAHHEAKGLQ